MIKEVAKECLFTSNKDYGHKGGDKEPCAHTSSNPWQNQNPEWETKTRTFTYDDNGQMTGCQESKGQFHKVTYTYTYDEVGNRTKAQKAKTYPYSYLESWKNTYTYNEDNQMVAATVCEGNLTKKYTFQYDDNGNLTKECFKNCAEVTYQYDTENRLAAVYDKNKLLVATSYDGDGNCVFQLNYNPEAECGYGMNVSDESFMPEHSQNEDESLTAEGQLFSYICSKTGRTYELTEYVNDINREYTEVLTAYNINTNFDTESYSYAGTQRVSNNSIWNEARNVDHNEMSYYLYDGRGSVTAKTWYNGMVTNAYQYDLYGQVTLGSTEHTEFYGYNAESYNPNTGLEYLRARYYNAEQGRFFQEDTYLGNITDPLTLNRYAYVKNSPMNYRDPSGESNEAALAGIRAHTTLETFLSVVYGRETIITEKRVFNMSYSEELEYNKDLYSNDPYALAYSKFKQGRLDIEYIGEVMGEKVGEVYEIKPKSWSRGNKLTKAKVQRYNYIEALRSSGENINAQGTTLNSVVNAVILPDLARPKNYFKYTVSESEPGLIFWEHTSIPGEKNLQEQIEEAREKAGITDCGEEEIMIGLQIPDGNLSPIPEMPGVTIQEEGGVIAVTGTIAAIIALLWELAKTGAQYVPLLM